MINRANRWVPVKDILQRALERRPEERTVYLDQACGADSAVPSEVDPMPRAHVNATAASFAGQPAIGALAVAQIAAPSP